MDIKCYIAPGVPLFLQSLPLPEIEKAGQERKVHFSECSGKYAPETSNKVIYRILLQVSLNNSSLAQNTFSGKISIVLFCQVLLLNTVI